MVVKDQLLPVTPVIKWSVYRTRRILVVLISLLALYSLWRIQYRQEVQARVEVRKRPPELSNNQVSKIAKVSVTINTLNTSIVAGALRTHQVQNSLHGYQHFVGTQALVAEDEDPQGRPLGTWSKPAYLLSILLAEMEKPQEDRLEWLFWFDADTIIINPHTRLETFLPPHDPSLNDIHLLLTKNWDGINAGVFPIRVHPWSVSLLSAYVAYPTLHPDEYLEFRDQTALSYLLDRVPAFRGNYSVVPHRWFNAFPINSAFDANRTWIYATPMTPDEFDDGEMADDTQPWKVLKGDMVVHFAGAKQRMSWMRPWLERTEMYLPQWSSSTYQHKREEEAKAFWVEEKVGIRKRLEEERHKKEDSKLQEESWKQEEEKRRQEEQQKEDEKRNDEEKELEEKKKQGEEWKRLEEERKKMEQERKKPEEGEHSEQRNVLEKPP